MNRRSMIKNVGSTIALSALGVSMSNAQQVNPKVPAKLKGNIKHSVCRWCYGSIPMDEFAKACVDMGIQSIELLGENEWVDLNKYGLKCAVGMTTEYGIPKGFNRLEYHDKLVAHYTDVIPKAAAAGVPSLICFSGNSDGQTDNDGLINCAAGLRKLMPIAEKYGVTLVIELLNTNDHKDYQCCKTSWASALCEMVGSERLKILYDIYHMQIMEGNVVDSIKKYHKYIGHYHTGGVPGRHEIDETQELNYPFIMRSIVQTGYTGYVAQEFMPSKENKLESLRQGILICDV